MFNDHSTDEAGKQTRALLALVLPCVSALVSLLFSLRSTHLDDALNDTEIALTSPTASPMIGAAGAPSTPVNADVVEHAMLPAPVSATAKHTYESPGRDANTACSGDALGDTVWV